MVWVGLIIGWWVGFLMGQLMEQDDEKVKVDAEGDQHARSA